MNTKQSFRFQHLALKWSTLKVSYGASKLFILAILFTLLQGCTQRPTQPNVLWIYLEDVSGWFSSYGDKTIDTPHIDAIAASGIRFDRFYTPAGVCSATRSAIVTGMMQTSIGAHNHRSGRRFTPHHIYRSKSRILDLGEGYDRILLPENVTPLPILFRKAGYWTFNEGSAKDDYNFEWDPKEFYDMRNEGVGLDTLGPSRFIAGEMLKGKPKGKPFFGQIQLRGGKLWKLAPKVVNNSQVSVPPYLPDVPEIRDGISKHYDCLLKTDQQVGEIIAALKEMDLYDNTVIFLFSDHGSSQPRFKQWLYESGINVPLMVSGPNIKPGIVRKDLVNGIDISATSLAVAGIPIPKSMEGLDFLAKDFHRDYIVSARDRCDYTIDRVRAIVTPRFKYMRNYLTDRTLMSPSFLTRSKASRKILEMRAKGQLNETQLFFFGHKRLPEEFYDLENDPHEINNLADDPKFAAEIERHRNILGDWIAETGDQGQQRESDIGLLNALKRWGNRCVNPEFDEVRHLLDQEKSK